MIERAPSRLQQAQRLNDITIRMITYRFYRFIVQSLSFISGKKISLRKIRTSRYLGISHNSAGLTPPGNQGS